MTLTPTSAPPLSPPPPPVSTPPPAIHHNILLSLFLALILPCAGMSVVFLVYICLLWYASYVRNAPSTLKPPPENGLSLSQLQTLPVITGKELVLGKECAVCLEEIESEEPVRLIPGCNHGFHLQCADTWLTKNAACPVCRTNLGSLFVSDTTSGC